MIDRLKTFLGRKDFAVNYRNHLMILLLNVPVIYTILLLNATRADFDLLSWVYFSCVVIGYYILPMLLIISIFHLLLFHFKRLSAFAAGIVIVIFVYYFLIDHFVYVIAKIHIDLFWLEWIFNDLEAFGLQASTFRNILLALGAVILLEFGLFKLARKIKKPPYLIIGAYAITMLAFAAGQIIHVVAYEQNYVRITGLTPHFPVYYPITSHSNAGKFGDLVPIDENNPDNMADDQNQTINYPRKELMFSDQPDKKYPNIVAIFLESWRIEMMNDSVTPNIYDLSYKSSVFTDHFCSGNSTIAGTFGFFYGIHPTYWTAVKANSATIDNPVLIDHLNEKQYSFGIYAKSNFVRHKIRDAMFRGITIHESFRGNGKIEQDIDMTAQVMSFIEERADSEKPFFAFVFYKSNHFPYEYPPEDSLFLPCKDINLMFTNDDTDPQPYLNDYMNSTFFVDRLIGKILDQLDSLGLMDNTIIAITSDHSDELNDNRANYWGHGSNFTKYQAMVPLVLYMPDREPMLAEYRTSHIDLVPTLMQEIFGCENDISDYSNGRNLYDKPDGIRPIVVGSYVNHAFIIENNVFEIFPIYTKKYKLDNINEEASSPPPQVLRTIMDEINHFYKEPD